MSGLAVSNALVVDDQGLVRAGMRSLLERATSRYAIHEAGSCQEAIAKLDSMSFELAFLDLHLGGLESGLDILRFIREMELPCRAIMLSGDDASDTVLHCIALGASGYITKASDDSRVFEKAIRSVLDGSVYLPASMLQRQPAPRRAPGMNMGMGVPGDTPESLGLSARQGEVLYHLCQGLSNKAIARQMGIGEGTVRKSYVSELLRLFSVSRRTELMIEVARRGLRLMPPAR